MRHAVCFMIVLGWTVTISSARAGETPATGGGATNEVTPAFEASLADLADSDPVGARLRAEDWASIQDPIAASSRRAEADGTGGYHATDPTLGWSIHYTANGTTRLVPRDAGSAAWQWSLRLAGYTSVAFDAAGQPMQLRLDEQGVTYVWDDNVSESWQVAAGGLEQGFTVRRRPADADPRQPLEMRLAWSGDLTAAQDRDVIAFARPSGERTFIYAGLRAWDAVGRELLTRLVLTGHSVALQVEDAVAIYPVTIDPVVQQIYLEAVSPDR